jgi:hypothetical protein
MRCIDATITTPPFMGDEFAIFAMRNANLLFRDFPATSLWCLGFGRLSYTAE